MPCERTARHEHHAVRRMHCTVCHGQSIIRHVHCSARHMHCAVYHEQRIVRRVHCTVCHEYCIVRRIFDRRVLSANARQGSMSLFPFPFHQKIFFRFFRELRRIPVRCHPAVSVSTCFAVLCGSFRTAIPMLLYSLSAIVVFRIRRAAHD